MKKLCPVFWVIAVLPWIGFGCVPLPIPHHVNSIELKGRVVDAETGKPIKGVKLLLDYGEQETLSTEDDGAIDDTFEGDWRFIVWFPLTSVDVLVEAELKELSITFSHPGYYAQGMTCYYRREVPAWSTSLGNVSISPLETEEIDLGTVSLKAR